MKRVLALTAIASAAALTGCQHGVSFRSSGGQVVRLDGTTLLIVQVDGVEGGTKPVADASEPKQGESIHRVLETGSGKVLFTYDLEVRRAVGRGYRFLLKPGGEGPTFDATREMTLNANQGAVSVELMEQAGTGRKIADVFNLRKVENHNTSIGAHLLAVHERFRRWMHGE